MMCHCHQHTVLSAVFCPQKREKRKVLSSRHQPTQGDSCCSDELPAKKAVCMMCYQHTVASRLLSAEEGRERGRCSVQRHQPAEGDSCCSGELPAKKSDVCDIVSAYSCQPSPVHRRGKRGRCSVRWHQPAQGDSSCSDELPAKNKQCM